VKQMSSLFNRYDNHYNHSCWYHPCSLS